MDLEALTPPQRRVVEDLFDLDGRSRRPVFDRDLPVRLRDVLEEGLAPVAGDLAVRQVFVSKRALGDVLACERYHVLDEDAGFGGWNPATARGTVAHKALELRVALAQPLSPLDLVENTIERLREAQQPRGLGDWLVAASPLELAELRAFVNEVVVKFEECWPPIPRAWRPSFEARTYVDLCDGRITLAGRVDLALGQAQGQQARVLIVDLKTGLPQPGHLDDLRYYALIHTIRTGVPPFRVASYYLDSCSFHHEDVDEGLLEQAAARVIDGVTRLVELRHTRVREPSITPGPRCGWCVDRHNCPGAATRQSGLAEEGPPQDDF